MHEQIALPVALVGDMLTEMIDRSSVEPEVDRMLTANILERVLFVRYHKKANETGSAFTIEVDGKQYIVTAAHLVKGMTGRDTLGVFYKGGFREIDVEPISCAAGDVDIKVLAASGVLTPLHPVELGTDGLVLTQDVFFLGFPYRFFSLTLFLADLRPIPLIKKGIVSQFDLHPLGGLNMFVDGHNNPGFSGGPLVFFVPSTNTLRVAGVVTAFKEEEEPVYDKTGAESPYVVKINTGIVVAYNIAHAVHAIKANPIGVSV